MCIRDRRCPTNERWRGMRSRRSQTQRLLSSEEDVYKRQRFQQRGASQAGENFSGYPSHRAHGRTAPAGMDSSREVRQEGLCAAPIIAWPESELISSGSVPSGRCLDPKESRIPSPIKEERQTLIWATRGQHREWLSCVSVVEQTADRLAKRPVPRRFESSPSVVLLAYTPGTPIASSETLAAVRQTISAAGHLSPSAASSCQGV